jgi:putative tryptophan/tyrosine transport system substrate-binding protein
MILAEGDPEGRARMVAFIQGLQALGWVENRNIRIEVRWTAGDAGIIRRAAAELVALSPDVILSQSTPALAALQKATSTIPIVFVSVSDPVGDGFVAALAKPAGNMTGFSNYEPTLAGKWLELVKQVAPPVERIAVLFNPSTAPHSIFLRPLETAASSLAVKLVPAPVRSNVEIESTVAAIGREPGGGLIVLPDAFTSAHRKPIIAVTTVHRLPAISAFRFFPTDGGLMSYGVDVPDQFWRASSYVDRILKGEQPANLPVQQPTKFEFVINLKTAKAIGLTVPPQLLALADLVIE